MLATLRQCLKGLQAVCFGAAWQMSSQLATCMKFCITLVASHVNDPHKCARVGLKAMDALPKFGKLRSTKTRAVGHAAYPKPVATVSQSPAFSSTIGGWRVNGVARRVTGFLICGFASWRRRRWSWRGIRGASHVRSGGEVLADLRHALDREGLQAYIVPTEEPHLSEIPPPCFARRKFLSGFTGSAGTCVVTEREALLWTDGRYFTQAGPIFC